MSVTLPSAWDAKLGMFLTIAGIATDADHEPGGKCAFDSTLQVSWYPTQNHVLKISMRIHLRQVDPEAKGGWYKESDGEDLFQLKKWSPREWERFRAAFRKHVLSTWNNKFSLIPPAKFSHLDQFSGRIRIRPNVNCHLAVDLVDNYAGSHHSVAVANIDKKTAAQQLKMKPSQLTGATIRSDYEHMDSLDDTESHNRMTDMWGKSGKSAHSTIAHEFGHMLGFREIGFVRKDFLCLLNGGPANQRCVAKRNSALAKAKAATSSAGTGSTSATIAAITLSTARMYRV